MLLTPLHQKTKHTCSTGETKQFWFKFPTPPRQGSYSSGTKGEGVLELKVDQYILAYNYGFWFQGSFAENFAFLLDSLKSGKFFLLLFTKWKIICLKIFMVTLIYFSEMNILSILLYNTLLIIMVLFNVSILHNFRSCFSMASTFKYRTL